ncbi:MAG TPA: LysM peptidoglycan-binding domain-containing protein [Phycisphaerales bacterium]|nr:LysM peptidoglycan-binding domain-containing protein [Phycisphaerales bacterium]
MQKDLKIGLVVGLAIVSIAGLWLATRPSLTPQSQLLDGGDAGPGAESVDPPVAGNLPADADNTRELASRNRSASRPSRRRAAAEDGIERSRLATAAAQVQPEKIRPEKFHIVRQGETLSEISYEYYGSAVKWRKIFDANRRTIKDANVVRAGTKLIIPN